MTAEEPIRPATDLEIAKIGAWNCDCSTKGPNHIWACLMLFGPRLVARIEADAATIRERDEEIAQIRKLDGDMIDDLRHERNVLQKIGAERSDEIEALRAQNAAQAGEIEKLKAEVAKYREGITIPVLETAELRAR